MNKNDVINLATEFINNASNNYITEEIALNPKCVGMKIYDAPLFAFGSADDELYVKYKSSAVIGRHFLSPVEWLPSAKTVISFFLPYTDKIKTANSIDCRWPADEWLHGRYEGQNLLKQMLEYMIKIMLESGYKALAPSLDGRFKTVVDKENNNFTSNWSERHVAYACGLGTFGLSKGIITERGMCGRIGSILTELDLPKNGRNYDTVYEYCTMCGVCIGRCPSQAISFEDGNKLSLCSDFLNDVMEKHNPRYGCGKCQVNVPCESGMPIK